MKWPDGRELGPNVRRLVAARMAMIAIPEGTKDPLGSAARALAGGKIADTVREAMTWVADALAVAKTAPDNPFGDDEEAIAGEVLRLMRERQQAAIDQRRREARRR